LPYDPEAVFPATPRKSISLDALELSGNRSRTACHLKVAPRQRRVPLPCVLHRKVPPRTVAERTRKTTMACLEAGPVLEGLLLRVLSHSGITMASSVDACKKTLYDGYVDKAHRTEPQAYARSFPKERLLARRRQCSELNALLGHLQ
ncbi:MAG: hypothetical protein R6X19_00410, partial [Kiritimatiellia bacterium]